jgi:hypothetical protein
MNTKIWGPPTWRFLHGTSFMSVDSKLAPSIGKIVRSLQYVMPCSFCRDSFEIFSKELNVEGLEDTIVRGGYAKWLYDIHNKVAAKLQRQVLEKSGVPPDVIPTVIAESQLTYSVLRKRLMITLPYFCEIDIFLMLSIMGLSAKEGDCMARKEHFISFATHTGVLLEAFAPFNQLGSALRSAFQRITVQTFDGTVMQALLALELGRQPTADDAKEQLHVLRIAKAGSCSVGVCI